MCGWTGREVKTSLQDCPGRAPEGSGIDNSLYAELGFHDVNLFGRVDCAPDTQAQKISWVPLYSSVRRSFAIWGVNLMDPAEVEACNGGGLKNDK